MIKVKATWPRQTVQTALPDGGFLRQIWKILADLKVIWRAKNISGGLLISGGFLADLTNFVWFCFCLADLADSGGFGVSINKKQLFFSLFLAFLGIYYLPVNQK
jgi:hypothetical protein